MGSGEAGTSGKLGRREFPAPPTVQFAVRLHETPIGSAEPPLGCAGHTSGTLAVPLGVPKDESPPCGRASCCSLVEAHFRPGDWLDNPLLDFRTAPLQFRQEFLIGEAVDFRGQSF